VVWRRGELERERTPSFQNPILMGFDIDSSVEGVIMGVVSRESQVVLALRDV
jgi:hypothetical protein